MLEIYFTQQNEETERSRYDTQIDYDGVKRLLGDKVSDECIKKIVLREKVAEYNLSQMIDLRKEIKKIEMHCIFDAFN